ncbi:MAG: hypothetical protein Q7W29_01490 [bacterium]|nr:hypothetical protein [bacterium]
MLNHRSLLAAGLFLCLGLPAAAQTVGVLQSAETMDPGTYKLALAPLMIFGEDGADDEFGVAGRAGYGFTESFDAEVKLGLFENSTYAGLDGELWLLHGKDNGAGLDASLTGGLHWIFGSDGYHDSMGFDLAPMISGNVSENLELCGALDASFESVEDVPAGMDDSYTRLHLVPGFEYRLSDVADLVGEVGVGLNDDSSTYVGIGFAFYLK